MQKGKFSSLSLTFSSLKHRLVELVAPNLQRREGEGEGERSWIALFSQMLSIQLTAPCEV